MRTRQQQRSYLDLQGWGHDHLRDTMADIFRYAGLKPVTTEELLLPCDGFKFTPSANTVPDSCWTHDRLGGFDHFLVELSKPYVLERYR